MEETPGLYIVLMFQHLSVYKHDSINAQPPQWRDNIAAGVLNQTRLAYSGTISSKHLGIKKVSWLERCLYFEGYNLHCKGVPRECLEDSQGIGIEGFQRNVCWYIILGGPFSALAVISCMLAASMSTLVLLSLVISLLA